MPKRPTLERRLNDSRCKNCGRADDPGLYSDEENALNNMLDAIKSAVEQAPQAARDAIVEAAKKAPRFDPDKRRGRSKLEPRVPILYLDDPLVGALIEELAGEWEPEG